MDRLNEIEEFIKEIGSEKNPELIHKIVYRYIIKVILINFARKKNR